MAHLIPNESYSQFIGVAKRGNGWKVEMWQCWQLFFDSRVGRLSDTDRDCAYRWKSKLQSVRFEWLNSRRAEFERCLFAVQPYSVVCRRKRFLRSYPSQDDGILVNNFCWSECGGPPVVIRMPLEWSELDFLKSRRVFSVSHDDARTLSRLYSN